MFRYLHQLWKSEDLRKRILITLALLVLYRIVAHIPVPGADETALRNFLSARGTGGALGVFAALTGGAIDNFSIVLLGLSPYINASIILQLCTVIFPKLEAIKKRGSRASSGSTATPATSRSPSHSSRATDSSFFKTPAPHSSAG